MCEKLQIAGLNFMVNKCNWSVYHRSKTNTQNTKYKTKHKKEWKSLPVVQYVSKVLLHTLESSRTWYPTKPVPTGPDRK